MTEGEELVPTRDIKPKPKSLVSRIGRALRIPELKTRLKLAETSRDELLEQVLNKVAQDTVGNSGYTVVREKGTNSVSPELTSTRHQVIYRLKNGMLLDAIVLGVKDPDSFLFYGTGTQEETATVRLSEVGTLGNLPIGIEGLRSGSVDKIRLKKPNKNKVYEETGMQFTIHKHLPDRQGASGAYPMSDDQRKNFLSDILNSEIDEEATRQIFEKEKTDNSGDASVFVAWNLQSDLKALSK